MIKRKINGYQQIAVNLVTCPINKNTISPVLKAVDKAVNKLTKVFFVKYFISKNDVIANMIR